jgi:hypothetical protein
MELEESSPDRLVYRRHRHGNFCTTMVLSMSPPNNTRRSGQPCMNSWMTATTATYFAWHSIREWNSIQQHEEFTVFGTRNPDEIAECHFEHRFSVKVWCELSGNNLSGPQSTEGRSTAAYYNDFFDKVLPLQLEDVSLWARRRIWLQHDESRRRFCRAITELMKKDE